MDPEGETIDTQVLTKIVQTRQVAVHDNDMDMLGEFGVIGSFGLSLSVLEIWRHRFINTSIAKTILSNPFPQVACVLVLEVSQCPKWCPVPL
jgi:hypothetical protein